MESFKYTVGDRFATLDKDIIEIVAVDMTGLYVEPYKVKSSTYTEQMSEKDLDRLTKIWRTLRKGEI